MNMKEWVQQVIKPAEIEKYLVNGKDFIDEKSIFGNLEKYRQPDKQQVRDILQKSLDIKLLSPEETAVLLNVEDPGLLEEMREAALQVKKKVYDNRIVFFAPLYCSNLCVNSCVYCGFRSDNCAEKRHVLTMEEVRRETEDPGLGKPVLVMRDTTERPEALAAGTVKLVGTDYDKIVSEVSALLDDTVYYDAMSKAVNPYGDGLACGRIVEFLNRKE